MPRTPALTSTKLAAAACCCAAAAAAASAASAAAAASSRCRAALRSCDEGMLCTRCIAGVFAVSMISDLLRSREGAWVGRGAAVAPGGAAGPSTAAATASAVRLCGQQMVQQENMVARTECTGFEVVSE